MAIITTGHRERASRAPPTLNSDVVTLRSKQTSLDSYPSASPTSPTSPDSALQRSFSANNAGFDGNAAFNPFFASGGAFQLPEPETFQHPHVLAILEQDDGLATASEAYTKAVSALEKVLSPPEMVQVRSGASIVEVLAVASEAQLSARKKGGKGVTEKFVDVLNHYAVCLDVLSQAYAEYTCLVWGSVRFLLQVSKNYYAFFEKIKDTMCEIGEDLPRILMYQQLLSTKRMQRIVAELYAHIVRFLQEAIVFYRRKRFMKYVVALWSPFDVTQKAVVDEIHRLRRSAEAEANAITVARQSWQNSALFWEMAKMSARLGEMHGARLFQDFQEERSGSILDFLRGHLFDQDPSDETFHDDMTRLYERTRSSEWDRWFLEERRHVAWSNQPKSTLTYMQTNLMEPQLYCKWIAIGRQIAGRAAFAHVFWDPTMNSNSAIASIIFQVLKQKSELVLRDSTAFARKLRAVTSFDSLWDVFLELLLHIPGLVCYVTIPSVGPEEVRVVEQLKNLVENWTGPPINMQLVTPLQGGFPKPQGLIDIDDAYDVEASLDTTDALHQVVLAELGLHSDVTERMTKALWQSLWRTTCYHIDEIVSDEAHDILLAQVETTRSTYVDALEDASGARFLEAWAAKATTWCSRRETLRFLRSIAPENLPFNILPATRDRLRREFQQTVALFSAQASPAVERDSWDPSARPRRRSEFQPIDMAFREETWEGMKDVLAETAEEILAGSLTELIRRALERSVWHADEAVNACGEAERDEDVGLCFDIEPFLNGNILVRADWLAVTQHMEEAMTDSAVEALKFGLWRTTVAVKGFSEELRGGFASLPQHIRTKIV